MFRRKCTSNNTAPKTNGKRDRPFSVLYALGLTAVFKVIAGLTRQKICKLGMSILPEACASGSDVSGESTLHLILSADGSANVRGMLLQTIAACDATTSMP